MPINGPETSRKYQRDWYTAHSLARNAATKKYRLAHPERISAQRARAHRTIRSRFRMILRGAKPRGLEVSISFDQYQELVSQPCAYCGGALPETGHGLDRINSEIGYVQGNVRPCCTTCNVAKNDLTESEFKEWALRLFNRWAGKTA